MRKQTGQEEELGTIFKQTVFGVSRESVIFIKGTFAKKKNIYIAKPETDREKSGQRKSHFPAV